MTLPPGQHLIDGFPRFGRHLSRPAPPVPSDPAIEIRGLVTEAFDVPLTSLATLPRRELTADFHCVAGWSATNLRWEGVAFETFYRTFIERALPPETPVTHVVFRGLDGYRSVVSIDDALDDDVLIAERLDGRPHLRGVAHADDGNHSEILHSLDEFSTGHGRDDLQFA